MSLYQVLCLYITAISLLFFMGLLAVSTLELWPFCRNFRLSSFWWVVMSNFEMISFASSFYLFFSFHMIFSFSFVFFIIVYFSFYLLEDYSNEIWKVIGSGREGLWGWTQKSRGRGNYSHDMLYEKRICF